MKKIMRLVPVCALCLSLSGCNGDFLPKARDITNVQLMRTMALDEGEEEGSVSVTVSGGVRPGDQGSQPQPPVILTWEAPTVFSACLTIQTYGDGYVSFGHVSQCVFSKEAAQKTVTGLLDFLERDFEMRLDTDLYVVEEGKASDLLTSVASETQSATDRLDSIARDMSLESRGWPVTVRDFLCDMEDNGCGLAPVIRLKEEEDGNTISCDRMCWFKEGKYGDMLDSVESRAAVILMGKAENAAIEVELSDGSLLGLRMTEADCSWEPKWEGDVLTGAEATVRVKTSLAELRGNVDLYEMKVQEEIDQKLSETLQSQLEQLLELSQEERADFLHLGRTLGVKKASKKQLMQEHWEEWFPELELTVKVDGELERSYDVNRAEEMG